MISAMIPVTEMAEVNSTLESAGYGPRNFSVPVFTTRAEPTHATLHAWGPQDFIDAVKALPNVVWSETGAEPEDRVNDAVSGVSGKWRGNPLTGVTQAGELYTDDEGGRWWCIQSYDTAIWPDPSAVPALIRRARVPGEVQPWVQPIDQFDAYKLVNPFTGEPDQVTHNGQTWRVIQADGAGNNVFEPGVFGWEVV